MALDTVLTDELIKEGLVRDTVRQCQLIRKEAVYEVEQRVKMAIESLDTAVIGALKEKTEYIKSELLADELILGGTLSDADLTKEVEIGDGKVKLAVA